VHNIDAKIAIPACKAAVQAAPDDPRIAYQLGRAYFAAKAYESARTEYEKADAANYALATNNLANIYSEGLGVTGDPPRALALFRKAASAGLGIAMYNLGLVYWSGSDGVAKDFKEARDWYLKGANAGNVSSMAAYAGMVYYAQGGPKDLSEARQWFTKAAEGGDAYAMNELGVMWWFGQGGPRDREAARRWLRKAADGGAEKAIAFFARENGRHSSQRGSRSSGDGNSGGYQSQRQGLSNRGIPCFVPSEKMLGGC
jgi:TPR repeat protein